MERPTPYIEKELSWLSFNERVLQEAEDVEVPLIERVRFLGIFSNNLDEFFRVRVADARRLAIFSSGKEREDHEQLLVQIRRSVKTLQQRFDKLNTRVMKELARRKIYLINENQLKPEQSAYVTRYFNEDVLPDLSPILVTESSEIPQIDDSSIYLGVKLHLENGKRYAIVNIPTEQQPRFIRIPSLKGRRKKVLIVLENVIRHCLVDIFRGTLPIVKAEGYVFKITRDAELELGEGITQSLVDKVATSLKRRKHGAPVRFVYDREMPEDLLDILSRRMGITTHDRMNAGGRYHNSKDFMDFPNLGPKYLEYKKLAPLNISRIDRNSNLFAGIREQDILLNYPYHSYRYIENLLQTAAIDPSVRSIKITLYRMARNSHIVNALTNAARNDKEVTAIVELQARFDEQANIDSARQLTEAGVNVIFGVPGLKVHSKLILITCQEGNTQKHYTHIGTGNFNEKTARVYTDLSLLTYDQQIGEEVANVFQFLQFNHLHFEYQHLFVSPHSTRSRIVGLIDREIEAAAQGKSSGIFLKCNNLVDNQLIDRLYKASQAGVKIKLIVRGMCSLVPGVKGVSENIEAVSIVDRFLEHSRIYVFHNGGEPKVYISSADLMTRNLDYRVEVSCPVYDEEAKRHLLAVLDLQWRDRAKARLIDGELANNYRPRGNKRKLRSQMAIYEYWKKQ